MQIVALNWQLYLLTHSAVALGLVGFARFVPIVFFSLVGGSFADNFNRKRVQIVCQSILAFITFILAFATLTHTINPIMIFALTSAASALVAFDMPARQALIPSLVSKEAFQNVMSLNSIQFQTASIVGPMIAGILIGKTGIGSVYILNALSFLSFVIVLFNIKASGDIRVEEKQSVSISHISEGIIFIKSKTIIWSTMILDFFSTFFASATALMPIFAKDILHVGPGGLGLLYSADAIGAVGSGFVLAHIGRIKNQGKVLLIAVACYAIGTIIFGFSKWYPISLIALMVVGAGDGVSAVIRNLLRQLTTPDELRGRMTSINMIFFMGGPQLGEFEAGLAAGAFGAPFSVIIGGLGTLLVVGLMAWKIPLIRNYSAEQKEPLL